MRIAHVIDTLDPRMGGPPMIAFRIAAGQAALGHDVSVITHTMPEERERVEAALAGVPAGSRVARPIIPPVIRAVPALAERRNAAAAVALEALLERADVVHFHSIWSGVETLGAILARRLGKPYCYILNGQLDPWSMRQHRVRKRVAMAIGVRQLLDDAAALQLGNEEERAGIAPLELATPIQRVIPNGIYLEEIDPLPPRGSFRADHAAFLGDGPLVLFLSRLHYKKGLDYLADAFARVVAAEPKARLVVAGPEDGAGDDFRDRVGAAGLDDRVLITGPIYGREKFELLADADVFCLPSRQEGFSIALLEALACGCPSVITEGCHLPEVGTAGAGYSVPLDADAIGDAILRVVSDPASVAAMRCAARRLVVEKYTWGRVVPQTITLYDDMLRDAGVARAPRPTQMATPLTGTRE